MQVCPYQGLGFSSFLLRHTLSGYPCGLFELSWSIPPPILKPHLYLGFPSGPITGLPSSSWSGSLFNTNGIYNVKNES